MVRHESDASAEEIVERSEGAEIIITKEIPVSGAAIRSLPSSVRLICEAGTGYNNIDLAAASERRIPPEVSVERSARDDRCRVTVLAGVVDTGKEAEVAPGAAPSTSFTRRAGCITTCMSTLTFAHARCPFLSIPNSPSRLINP